MPANVSNGCRIQGNERAQVIHFLAQGFSVHFIANRLKRDYATIAAVRDVEFDEIQKRKPILAAQAERGALEAGEKIVEAVRNGDIKGAALIPAYGVFVDKSLVLRGEPGFIMRHEHFHRVDDDDLYSFAVKRSEKLAQATVIDSPPMLTNGDSPTSQSSAHVASHGKGKRTAKGKRNSNKAKQ